MRACQNYIGLVLLLMPLALHVAAAGAPPVSTVSAYYHTPARPIFLWMLALTAFLFFTYQSPKKRDLLVSFAAGWIVIGLALFPLIGHFRLDPADACLFGLCHSPLSQAVHVWCGTLFGLTSLYLVLGSFPTAGEGPKRKAAYRWCAAVMVGGYVAMQLFGLLGFEAQRIWPETLALLGFAFAWVVKGGLVFGGGRS